MRVLVTGGAGYIGAHTSLLLAARGDRVLIVDDLVTGTPSRIAGLPLIQLDLTSDRAVAALTSAIREYEIDAVIHFAARKQVGESVQRPAWYYQQNIGALAHVLLAMEQTHVTKLVFSSSAAVYGEASGAIDESAPTLPVNPYGATKLAGEQLIHASTLARPLAAASLRYFNVGGATAPELGDTEALNLIPLVLDRLVDGESPLIFGDDYDTADGTCLRDYVHVGDVAEAHLAVLDSLTDGAGHTVLNIGTGVGTSVREMVATLSKASGMTVEPQVLARRPGDAATVVAVVDRVAEMAGWVARYTLDDIVNSAWESRRYFDSLGSGAVARSSGSPCERHPISEIRD